MFFFLKIDFEVKKQIAWVAFQYENTKESSKEQWDTFSQETTHKKKAVANHLYGAHKRNAKRTIPEKALGGLGGSLERVLIVNQEVKAKFCIIFTLLELVG